MTSPQDNPNRAIEQVREGTTTALTKGRAILDKGKETIASLEAANADLQNDIREAHLKGKALLQHARRQMEGLNNYFAPFLSESSKQLQELSSHLPIPMAAEWSVNAWQQWDVLPIPRLDLLRYGIMKESRAEGQVTLPAFVLAASVSSDTFCIHAPPSGQFPSSRPCGQWNGLSYAPFLATSSSQ